MGEHAGAPMQPGLYNMDCMDALKQFPDGFFDLAVVDPPYGDAGLVKNSIGGGRRFGERFDRYKHGAAPGGGARPITSERMSGNRTDRGVTRTGGTWATKYAKKSSRGTLPRGRSILTSCSASHVTRSSGGGNYFDLPPCRCFLIWEKLTISETFSMAMAEYAWTSFNSNAKIFKAMPQSKAEDPRFHPTQKPVELYSWILDLYAKPGMRILDTHAGSASSLVACHRAGLDAWGFEIDEIYYKKASERLARERAQVNIMDLLKGEDNFDQLEIAFAE